MTSNLDSITLLEDDPEDLPTIDELLEIYLEGTEEPARFPESKIDEPAIDKVDEDIVAWDDVKNRPLDPERVVAAREVEMGYVFEHGVYDYASVDECRKETGAEPVGTRWLDTNKCDEAHPCYRSQWVA